MRTTINMSHYDETVVDIYDRGAAITIDTIDTDGDRTSFDATNDEAIRIADAIYEAAGRKPPSQLVKASELGANDALIRIAELHGLKVRFRYAKSDHDPVEIRTFVPKSLKIMEDHTTFIGVDEDRGGFRSFRTDRIKGIVEVVA